MFGCRISSFVTPLFVFVAGVLVSLAALAPVAPFAHADYIPPDQVVIHTEAYQPKDTAFAVGTYKYDVNWQGIPVGRGTVTVTPTRTDNGTRTFTVRATAESASVVAIFYTLKHVSESVFRADNLAPIIFSSVQTENSRTKSREVRFGAEGNITSTMWSWKKGSPVPEEEHAFQSSNTTFDPITAAFLARSLDVGEGQDVSFDVFNGKHRFLITLKKGPLAVIKVDGVRREAFPVTPIVKKLTDSEGETRLRQATIWISNDRNRDVLKIESKVLIGSVRVELESFVPAPQPPALPEGASRASLGAPEAQAPEPQEAPAPAAPVPAESAPAAAVPAPSAEPSPAAPVPSPGQ